METRNIKVIAAAPFKPMRSIYVASTQMFVIGIGVLVDSSAMQWTGFLLLILFALTFIIMTAKPAMTIDEARSELDRLEAEARGKNR